MTSSAGFTHAQSERDTEESSLPVIIWRALETAISLGHFLILRKILDVVPGKFRSIVLLKDLVQVAISAGNPLCCREVLSRLKDATEIERNDIDLRDFERDAIIEGNALILWQVLSLLGSSDLEWLENRLLLVVRYGSQAACELARILLEASQDLSSQEKYSLVLTKVLGVAIEAKTTDVMPLLLERGADPNTKTANRESLLYYAVCEGYIDIIKQLIKAGADLSAQQASGETPAHGACKNAEITGLLLEAGADPNVQDRAGLTPLQLSMEFSCQEVVEEHLRHITNVGQRIDREEILLAAVQSDNSNIIAAILDIGPDLAEYVSRPGKDPLLHVCVKDSRLKSLEKLLTYNIDIEEVDGNGSTALNSIHSRTGIEIVRALINRGASLSTADNEKESPLVKAVFCGNQEVAEFLISKGANVNDLGGFWGGVIHHACRYSTLSMVQMLVDNGADLNLESTGPDGTPFQAACLGNIQYERKEILLYLINNKALQIAQYSDWWGYDLNTACLMTDIDVVNSLLLRQDAAINSMSDRIGRLPIHFALYRTLDIVQRLIGEGADLFGQDFMQRNALHFAVVSGRLDIVQYVLEQRKELVHHPDIDGWTPLFWAVRYCGSWRTEDSNRTTIIEELLSCGADRMLLGHGIGSEWTPYKLAIYYYGLDESILQLLRSTDKEIKDSKEKNFWKQSLQNDKRQATWRGDWCCACLMVSSLPFKRADTY